jgi:putative flippase GtrA
VRTNIETEETTKIRGVTAAASSTSQDARGVSAVSNGPARTRPILGARILGQIASFGLVGGIAFVVDVGVYNALRATLLQDSPIWSKVVSVAVATVVAWLGNRYLTFRRERSPHAIREGVLFAVINVVGLLIAAGCLFVSHYVFGFTSQLADNISGNGVGLVLGTLFRFVAYRWLVFSPQSRTAHPPRSAHRIVRLDAGGLS